MGVDFKTDAAGADIACQTGVLLERDGQGSVDPRREALVYR